MEFWIDSMSVLSYPGPTPNTMLLGKVRVNFSSLSLSSLSSLLSLVSRLGSWPFTPRSLLTSQQRKILT